MRSVLGNNGPGLCNVHLMYGIGIEFTQHGQDVVLNDGDRLVILTSRQYDALAARDAGAPAPLGELPADDEAAEIEYRIRELDKRAPGYIKRLHDGLGREITRAVMTHPTPAPLGDAIPATLLPLAQGLLRDANEAIDAAKVGMRPASPPKAVVGALRLRNVAAAVVAHLEAPRAGRPAVTPAPSAAELAVVDAAVALHARREQARAAGDTAFTQNFGPLYAAVDRLLAHRAGRPA